MKRTWTLGKIFGLYTVAFLAVTMLIGLAEYLFGLPPRWIGWIFKIPLVRVLADQFYRWFARNRYKLGCGEHCQLKPAQLDYGEEGR